jgi:hypothetical protein
MDEREFYDYIVENFNLDSYGTAGRLVNNIIQYVASQRFADVAEAHQHLYSLLDAFGLEFAEIQQYRSYEN